MRSAYGAQSLEAELRRPSPVHHLHPTPTRCGCSKLDQTHKTPAHRYPSVAGTPQMQPSSAISQTNELTERLQQGDLHSVRTATHPVAACQASKMIDEHLAHATSQSFAWLMRHVVVAMRSFRQRSQTRQQDRVPINRDNGVRPRECSTFARRKTGPPIPHHWQGDETTHASASNIGARTGSQMCNGWLDYGALKCCGNHGYPSPLQRRFLNRRKLRCA